MIDALTRRMAALAGLALAAAVALWWLGSTRLALDSGSDASRSADAALQLLWLVRGMALVLLGTRVAALRGWAPGLAVALGLVAPAWPLVVLAWSASAAPFGHVALLELLLLAGCLMLPLLGLGLRRALRQTSVADGLGDALGTVVGAALAAAVWFTRGLWALPSS